MRIHKNTYQDLAKLQCGKLKRSIVKAAKIIDFRSNKPPTLVTEPLPSPSKLQAGLKTGIYDFKKVKVVKQTSFIGVFRFRYPSNRELQSS